MRKTTLAAIVLLLTLSVACERYVDERNPVVQAPSSGPEVVNLQTFINDASVLLTWDMSSTAGVIRYRIYRSDSVGAPADLIDSSSTTRATLTGLRVNRTHWLRVAPVLSSGLEATMSDPVLVVPGHLSLRLDGGADYTNDRDIMVNINAGSGATDVLLSESVDLSDAVWQAFSTAVSFRLSAGDETKTVYGLVRFADGSRSGDTLSDSIILDSRASIGSISFSPTGSGIEAGDTIVFSMQTGETDGVAEVSFPGVSSLELNDDGVDGDATADDGAYTGRWIVPRVFHVTSGIVRGVFVDAAGNRAPETPSESLIDIHTAPLAPVLRAVATASDEVFLTWDDAGNEGLAAWRLYRGNGPTVTTADQVVTTITSTGITTYSDTALVPGTTYYYRVYAVFDEATMTGSNTVSVATPSSVSSGHGLRIEYRRD